jgi:Zn-dependent peptidase ImmA (M78 family)
MFDIIIILTNFTRGGIYMKKINNVFDIIKKENIIYEETNLKHINSKGIYFKVYGIPPVIAIDASIVNYKSIYISILAEELGHHFTTQGNLLEASKNHSDKLQKNKKETIAKKWAANLLISDDEFVLALHRCISSNWDMCDHFTVTNEILKHKILSIINDEDKYIRIKNDLKSKEVQFEACNI